MTSQDYRNGFLDAMLVARNHIDAWMGEGGRDTLDDLNESLWRRFRELVDGAPAFNRPTPMNIAQVKP